MAMFYESDDELFFPDVVHIVRRELYAQAINSTDVFTKRKRNLDVPTHTEDGIPIRKIYVTSLPAKTTRLELFAVFAQYGFIKSCWLKMGERGPNKTPIPTYAFVTFGDPADARKALCAPPHEKKIRDRILKISPADSWHQPAEDINGRVQWKQPSATESSHSWGVAENLDVQNNNGNPVTDEVLTTEESYNILDVLNMDCWSLILSHVPLTDLIRSERVSKKWKDVVHLYLNSIRTFKTSSWQLDQVKLTTAVLRQVLQRFGASLIRLHIDHNWSDLNDRTAHTVGKYCPNLEEVKVAGMHTKNWNPLMYGCKQLKKIDFVSCYKLTDASLVHVVKSDASIEELSVSNNTHLTGLFLTNCSKPSKLTSLSFYNCYSLQGTVVNAAMDTLPCLTCLKLDVCPPSMWKLIPNILRKVPQLEELSLSENISMDGPVPVLIHELCDSIGILTKLKRLNLSRNIFITNEVIKQVAQSCSKLEDLNISGCNSRKSFSHKGVSDESIVAICSQCTLLTNLNVSYLAGLSNTGLAAVVKLSRLVTLMSRGNISITAKPIVAILNKCHYLEELDLCGCESVTEEVISAGERALLQHPRPLALLLGGTAAAGGESPSESRDTPTHQLLSVDLHHDKSNPHMRPDFIDRIFESSSDDSYDEVFDHDDIDFFDQFLSDEEDFLQQNIANYDGFFNNILLI
ncbi:F-box/LRR-repeat protein 7-like [Leptidea sinapis]|uniref:F-box/LRR-repeat protein 7-like n=1 Tax=Leptidea sinapis TaxID=189913 RepID=UPI002125047D|nr:F-box/LRR-repeat protein 7-like [Leptidea sinapis]